MLNPALFLLLPKCNTAMLVHPPDAKELDVSVIYIDIKDGCVQTSAPVDEAGIDRQDETLLVQTG